MGDQKLDRRVQRTRALLRDALFELINEKGYASIKIQDITDRANLNRVTFYFHYKDKDDLMFKVMQDLYDTLAANQSPTQSLHEWSRQDTLSAFRHIQAYAHLYKVLLSEKGSISLIGRLMDYFAQEGINKAKATLPNDANLPLPLEIAEHFYAGAFVGLVRWWVLHDMPYTPEAMAEMCHKLETNSGMWTWGLDDRDLTLLP